ncbi:MAG TPA: 4a-hydroxytetrahydrobiopterin dehydratase [Vicinamibacterales bacterium]|nr:4a-hydroxytetrahydrobiopterin dehydratase [Vicinamibacterales bacterium]
MLLGREEIERRLREREGWRLEGDAIVRQFTFPGFPEAVAFVNRLVPGCEAADHHPDVTINYKRVTLSYSTHSEGGITEKDFAGAAAADALAHS